MKVQFYLHQFVIFILDNWRLGAMSPNQGDFVGALKGHLNAIGQPCPAPDFNVTHLCLVVAVDQLHIVAIQ